MTAVLTALGTSTTPDGNNYTGRACAEIRSRLSSYTSVPDVIACAEKILAPSLYVVARVGPYFIDCSQVESAYSIFNTTVKKVHRRMRAL